MMINTSQGIETFLNFLRETERQYHIAEANEQESNGITNDLHHMIELGEQSDQEALELFEQLKQARRQRRKAKDTMSETLPVLDWIDSNRQTIKSLEQLLGKVRKAEKDTENRIYTPRVKREAVNT